MAASEEILRELQSMRLEQKKDHNEVMSKLKNIEENNSTLTTRTDKIESKVKTLDKDNRKRNVIIYGGIEKETESFEDLEKIISNVINTTMECIITFQLIYSDLTFRISKAFLHTNALLMRYFQINATYECDYKRIPPPLTSIELCSYQNVQLEDKEYSLSEMITIHTTLCSAVQQVNAIYGFTLLTILLSTCFHFTTAPYFFFLNLFYPAVYGTNDFGFLILQIFWILTYFFQLLIIIVPASKASQEAHNTGVILCEFLSKHFNYAVLNQMETIIVQMNNPAYAEFTACGLMKLKLATLTTILGTVATYLVILIQFQNADKINQIF
ncbi:hypothetical protein M8J77_013185 [Diaphorina citri]|nr:hypothetical protein M8J77_013185 [Diaphorina citri]